MNINSKYQQITYWLIQINRNIHTYTCMQLCIWNQSVTDYMKEYDLSLCKTLSIYVWDPNIKCSFFFFSSHFLLFFLFHLPSFSILVIRPNNMMKGIEFNTVQIILKSLTLSFVLSLSFVILLMNQTVNDKRNLYNCKFM